MSDVRLIDANALKVRMFRSKEFNRETGSFDLPVVPWHDIEDADTIDAAPVVHGRLEGNHLDFKCSVCGTVFHDDILWIQGDCIVPKYCPECGVRWAEVANE